MANNVSSSMFVAIVGGTLATIFGGLWLHDHFPADRNATPQVAPSPLITLASPDSTAATFRDGPMVTGNDAVAKPTAEGETRISPPVVPSEPPAAALPPANDSREAPSANTTPAPAAVVAEIPAGTSIVASTAREVCTNHRHEPTLTLTVDGDVQGVGGATIPAGTLATVSVDTRRTSEGKVLVFEPKYLTLPSATVTIDGTVESAEVERVVSSGDRVGGALVGALVGAVGGKVVGGSNKAAAEGAAAGATVGAAAAPHHDECLRAGGRLTLSLVSPIRL